MAYGSYEELVCDKQVELVYIATPVTEHYNHIRMCLEHKIPVICEKPFALSAKEAEELFRLADEHGVFLADGLRLRFLPFGRQIKEVLESGVIGTPKITRWKKEQKPADRICRAVPVTTCCCFMYTVISP